MSVSTAMPVSIAGSGKLEIITEWEMTMSDEKLTSRGSHSFPSEQQIKSCLKN